MRSPNSAYISYLSELTLTVTLVTINNKLATADGRRFTRAASETFSDGAQNSSTSNTVLHAVLIDYHPPFWLSIFEL